MCLFDEGVIHSDFRNFRVLGKGGFGAVNGCKRLTTGRMYANKTQNKHQVVKKKAINIVKNEKTVLQLCAGINSQFVAKLVYAYQTVDNVHLILTLYEGGDLGFHLEQEGTFSNWRSKFYIAQILLGLEAIHSIGWIYRVSGDCCWL